MLLIFFLIVGAILGLIIGSFTTALLYRDAHGISMTVSGGKVERSKCTHCDHRLAWYDLVPFFSWVQLKGKCRYCFHKIGKLYPIVEISCALCSLFLFGAYGFSLTSFLFLAILPPALVLLVNPLRGGTVSKKLALYIFFTAMLWWGLEKYPEVFLWSELRELLLILIVYGISSVTFSLVSTLLYKRPFSAAEITLFLACGIWLGLGFIPLFCLFTVLFIVFYNSRYFVADKIPVASSIASSFLLLSMSIVTVNFYEVCKAFVNHW